MGTDKVERDFSMRQDSAHSQEEVVTEERDSHPNSQVITWVSIYADDTIIMVESKEDLKNWLILKTVMLRKIECRRRGWQNMRWWMPSPIDGHEFEHALGVLMDRETCVLQSMGSQRFRHDWAVELKWRNVYIHNIGGNLTNQIFSIESRGKDYNF